MADKQTAFVLLMANEGGYATAFGQSGETYKGIDRLHFPNWQGWAIIDAYKSNAGGHLQQYTIFNNAQLNALVASFYDTYFERLLNVSLIVNQDIANMVCDFIFHKLYDAIKVINAAAITVKNTVDAQSTQLLLPYAPAPEFTTAVTTVSFPVIYYMNASPYLFYNTLRAYRIQYYQNPAAFGSRYKFSPALIAAFIDRVNKYPTATA